MNNTNLQGRLTKDVELKHTGSGTAVASFTIAVERPFKGANGERETDFINVVAWRKTAEIINQYFNKGDGIIIQGRIQTRNYENNEGKRVYITEVVADNFSFPLQNKKQERNKSQQDDSPFDRDEDSVQIDDSMLPF